MPKGPGSDYFVAAAEAALETLPAKSVERLILEFLLRRGRGRHNAQPWAAIDAHLQKRGVTLRQQTFQQGLLKTSREGSIFIASNDHGVGKGYFLIQDSEDAEIMRRWYVQRIKTEQSHLDRLDVLITNCFGED